MRFKEIKSKFKSIGLAIVTALGVVSPVLTTNVSASGLDVRAAINTYINVTATGAHYSFNGGNNFDVIMTGSKEQLNDVGLDCTAGAVTIAAHAISMAGGNPYDYFGMLNGVLNNVYPPSLNAYFQSSSKWTTVATGVVDASVLQPGDLLIYGTSGAGHMAIYAGGGEIFDFRSNGNGSTGNYRGYANYSPYSDHMSTSSGGGINYLSGVYRANLNKDISVTIHKQSSNTSITDGNALYSSLKAEFGIYSDGNCTNLLTSIWTDDAGNGSSGNMTVGSDVNVVYVKELTAPTNYKLDQTVQAVDVSNGSGSITISDECVNDPLFISITKVDSEGKTVTSSMAGAKFKVNYYDTLTANSAADVANLTPTRTWIMQTVENNGSYRINFNEPACLVEGELYQTLSGHVTMPLGCITIEEIEPVTGYTTNGGFIAVNNEKVSDNASDVVFVKYINDNSSVAIRYGNGLSDQNLTKEEDSIRGGYKVIKQDYSTGTIAQGDATLAGAEFDLYYLGDGTGANLGMKLDTNGDGKGDGTEYFPSETTPIDHIVIGEDGTYSSASAYLGYGKYKLVETKAGDGYLTTSYDSASITKEFFVSDDETIVEFPVDNYPKLGSFTLQKNDAELQEAYAQGDSNLKTTFEIVNASDRPVTVLGKTYAVGEAIDIEGNGSTTFTTDNNGFYKATEKLLPYGTYTINEVNVPEGYTANGTTTHTFSIREHGEIYNATFEIFNEVIRGGFEIQKNDTEYDTRSQGDTNLQTSFEIYNRSAYDVLVDVNGDGILDKETERFSPNELITTFTTNNEGYYVTSSDYLPYGTYEIVEKTQPTGYTHNQSTTDGVLTTTFSIREDKEMKDLTYEIFNRVDYGKFEVYKVAANSTSDWTEPEANVEFTAILSSKIGDGKEFETFDDAYNYIKANANADGDVIDNSTGRIVFTKHEYAVITTSDDGKATSNDMAYGTYTIKQTSHVEDTKDVVNEATFVVKEDGQATVHYTATNTPMKYKIHMIKTDKDTGKTVSLNSAEFKIFQLTDRKGNEVNEYLKQKVGLFTYDTFKTNSDNNGLVVVDQFTGIYTDNNDDKGSITTPLELEAGTYRIDEIKTPDGYLQLDEPIEFEVKESTITRHDDDDDAIIDIEIANNKPHGELVIEKKLEDFDYDTTLLRDEDGNFDYSSIQFELRAAEDIIDVADGSVATAKGELANNVYGETVGSITLDAEGKATVSDLPLGKYELVETYVPAGVVLDNTVHSVEFTQEDDAVEHKTYQVTFSDENQATTDWDDNGTKVQTGNPTIINKVTKTWISKKSATTGEELEGAQLTLTDSEGNVIDSWVSTKEEHKIEGLVQGATYTLTEVTAPEPYAKATSVDFTIEEEQTKVEMIDKIIDLTKKSTVDGKELPGATIQIIDEDGNIIDEWISTTEEHKIKGLEVGKTYTMHEENAPDGYYYAEDATFTVEDDGVNQHETMYDNVIKYEIAKVDDKDGSYVKGVTLKLVDVTDSSNPVEIELPNDGVTTDKPFELIGKLIAGHKYSLTEEEWVAGVYKVAEAVEFTVPKTGSSDTVTTITMVDETTNIAVRKVDNYGNVVAGAKMQIIEAELEAGTETTDNEVIKDDTAIDDAYLVDDETVETDDVANYDDEIMPLNETSEEKPVVDETDESEEVSKEEATENEATKQDATESIDDEYTISDSELKYVPVKNEDGTDKVVYEFTTTDDIAGEDISQYVKGGGTYILREIEAPFGFKVLDDDQVFTVTGKLDSPQTIVAVDARETYYVSAVKVDKADHTKLLKGAEITLFNADDDSIATDVNGKKCVGYTDGKGVITWNVEYTDAGYYVKETNAPAGYNINKNKYAVELSDDFFESEERAYQIVVEDEIIPVSKKSGVGITGGLLGAGLGSMGLLGAMTISDKKKKKDDSEESDN